MVVWSSTLRSITRFGLNNIASKPTGLQTILQNAGIKARQMSDHRMMVIAPSRFQWNKFKDNLHFYSLLGVIIIGGTALVVNLFVGPATLTPIPAGYEPKHWEYHKVENECGEIPTVIVQNKIDLMDQAIVSPEEVEQLARNLGCRLIRTSVKEDVNVSSVFRYLATKCHQIMMQQYNVVLVNQQLVRLVQHLQSQRERLFCDRPRKHPVEKQC